MKQSKWTKHLSAGDKKTVAYIRKQALRLGEFYNIKLSDNDIQLIYFFSEEHLTDSHQVCDVIELVAIVKSETKK